MHDLTKFEEPNHRFGLPFNLRGNINGKYEIK